MIPFVLSLADPKADLATVGGKGMSLARMVNAGLPVPGGFHVTTEAYLRFVAENELQPRILDALKGVDPALPSTLEVASAEIGLLFARAEISSDLANAIAQAYVALPGSNPAVAVRSSATAEDLPEASFAGQQETYLNIRGADAVLEATRKCWASLWTARAIGYRIRQHIVPEGVALAVVVQLLVPAEAAGIMFTANPLNGKRSEVVINASWGLGEAVVGGTVTPDTITVDKRSSEVVRRETAEKRVMTVCTETGTEEQTVPNHLKNAPVLSDAQVLELAKLGIGIERLYKTPMDIEWTLAVGKFSIVQARPVTALSETSIEWAPPNPKGTYMRGSVVDLMPDPLSPLFVSLAIPTLKKQMKPLGARMTYSEPVLQDDYFTAINGYAYMNAALPPKVWWWILTGMLPAYPILLRRLVTVWREELHPEYQAVVAKFQAKVPGEMLASELWRDAQTILDAAMYYVCGLMFATMGASAGSEILLTKVYDKFLKQAGDPSATILLMGWDNIPIRAEKSLYDLALWVSGDKELAGTMLETPTAELVSRLATSVSSPRDGGMIGGWTEFASRFEQHQKKFGHIIFQLDFASDLPRDHPEPMLENIKMYLRGEGINPHERQKAGEWKRIQMAETMLKRLKGLKLWVFRKALNWAQSLSEVREDALAEIGLGYPILRAMLPELGNRFVEAGVIQQAEDIYCLEKEEIETGVANLEHRKVPDNLSAHVEERKALWKRLRKETPPPVMPVKERIMGIKVDVFVAHSGNEKNGNVLKGVAASPGKVTAPACVLHDPDEFGQMKPGDVLVAGTTTPAWTPLFTMASAIVTDIGGPLSHGSIVAREYGIPAVMGTGVATRRIQDGQVITVDGNTGTVMLGTDKSTGSDLGSAKEPTEWKLQKGTYAAMRNNIVELMVDPLSPLFATLGRSAINTSLHRFMDEAFGMHGIMPEEIIITVNGYAYNNGSLSARNVARVLFESSKIMKKMFTGAVERWIETGRPHYYETVSAWQAKSWREFKNVELVKSAKQLTESAIDAYGALISGVIPAAWITEGLFTKVYNLLIKRRGDPAAATYLLGYDSLPIRADKSLYSLAEWARQNPTLAQFLERTPTPQLVVMGESSTALGDVPSQVWQEWCARIHAYLQQFGHAIYNLDFAYPVPVDDPAPLLDTFKHYLRGQGTNPYTRQQESAGRREQAVQAMKRRLKGLRLKWFSNTLVSAQKYAPLREDGLVEIGLAYPLIRQMLRELGNRFTQQGAIHTPDDIYWLTEEEVLLAAARLDAGLTLDSLAGIIPQRKAERQAAMRLNPPVALPQMKLFGLDLRSLKSKRGRGGKGNSIKGVAASSGKVTGVARVLHGPDEFNKMQPGDVLVAAITTPAWTPLFALASAVVTDVGGPLSHGSIVAREYGIPAVLGTGTATRRIQSGQVVTVDGSAGIVIIETGIADREQLAKIISL